MALAGAPAKVPSITNLEEFQLQTNAASGADHDRQRQLIERDAARPTPGTAEAGSRSARLCPAYGREHIREQPAASRVVQGLPAEGAVSGERVGQSAEARRPTDRGRSRRAVFYVTLNGFDTHANQLTAHANLLRELSDAMTAFYKDMAARGHGERLS